MRRKARWIISMKKTQELNSLEGIENADRIRLYQNTQKKIKTGKKGMEIT